MGVDSQLKYPVAEKRFRPKERGSATGAFSAPKWSLAQARPEVGLDSIGGCTPGDAQAAAKNCGWIQPQKSLQAACLSSHCSSALEAPSQLPGMIGEDKGFQDLAPNAPPPPPMRQAPPVSLNVNIEASQHFLAASATAEGTDGFSKGTDGNLWQR